MKKRILMFLIILFLLALEVNVYAIENNSIIKEEEDIVESQVEEQENNNIIMRNDDFIKNVMEENESDNITIKVVSEFSGIEKIKENGIYKISTSQDIYKSIEVPGGNEDNNVQLGIWDYR